MSTASAVLRQVLQIQHDFELLVPMSTASAVLRQDFEFSSYLGFMGTYVYRFGGIETHRDHRRGRRHHGTYVYRFGGIETNPTHSLNNTIQGTHVYRIVCEAKQGQSNIPFPGIGEEMQKEYVSG